MTKPDMYLVDTSLVCPVGLNAAAAGAAMRTGIAGFKELPYYDNKGQPVIGAPVPGLDFELKRSPRIISLVAKCLIDLVESHPGMPTERMPLLVGLAEPGRPGGSAGLADKLIRAVHEETKIRFHPRFSRALPEGHVAGFEGLRVARQLLKDEQVPACVVCGVDSYINAAALHWLEKHGRLKTPENSNGVIPGEASGAVVVQKAPPKSRAAVSVAGLGFAREKAPVLSEEPFLGLGLAEATRLALAEAAQPLHQMDFRLSDVTGESYGFKEQALVLARVMRGRREEFPIWHCSDAIGDTGAASGVCHLIRGFEAFVNGYAPGDKAVGFASSVPGQRAVVILQRNGTASVSGAKKMHSLREPS